MKNYTESRRIGISPQKHVNAGKIEGRICVTGRGGRRSKRLLYDLKEREDTGNVKKKH
jgi:hypothetical protein